MLNFGGFLSSNFWSNYRCQSSASIEDLLNSKDCNVDKLLDDDDCLQEFKNYNDKLIKYFDHDKLKTLIDYITVMPTKDDGHNRGHKYPFVSGEIFNCEINQLLDRFFEAPIKVKEIESEDKEKSEKDDKEDSDAGDSDDEKIAEKKKTDEAEKEEQKDETKEGAAANLEEVAENKEASTEETATKEEGDANPQALDENKEKVADAEENKTEEVKKADAPESEVEAKEEDKKDDKEEDTEQKDEKKEEVKDEEKNTQEPESEEQEVKEAEIKPVEEEKKESEPEEEAPEKKADETVDSTTPLSTEATAIETLPTEGELKDDEPENRFVLLDRLFLFIEDTDEDLNPVLAGYFCKLVSLLISRKQKSLVPYIFSPGSSIIDKLLKHVYQKSISEVLNKLLTQLDSDFEPELQEAIHQKQQEAVATLISQLGPDKTAEHNLNTCTIIQDMFESKEFFNILCKKDNLDQIITFATAGFAEGQKSSKTSSLQILNQIITSLNDKQNKKGSKESDKQDRNMDEDDDDMIVQQKSDDEDEDVDSNPNSIGAQVNNLVASLQLKITQIEEVLKPDHEGTKIRGSVTSVEQVPLGQQRLLTVELLHNMILLKKEVLLKPISVSPACTNIVALVKAYPWNNFLQLKVMNLFTEVIEKSDNETFRRNFLETSGIAAALVEMGGQAWFKMESGRLIRNGFMNLVVQISNQLIKRADQKDVATDAEKKEDSVVVNYLEVAGETWKAFVDDELKKSNDNNNKTLGGSTTQKDKESDNEDSSYDVQMEKIMARFTNFNQILSQGNSVDDDEENSDEDDNTQDEDKEDKKGSKNFDEDDDDDNDSHGQDIKKVDVKGPGELVKEFCDNNYWDIGAKSEDIDFDDLYAQLDD